MKLAMLKVDYVTSTDEAEILVQLGVSHICVRVAEGKDDAGESISLPKALEIKAAASGAKFGIEFPRLTTLVEVQSVVKETRLNFVQFDESGIPPADVQCWLNDQNIPVFFTAIDVSYDTDPSWILAKFLEEEKPEIPFYQIDLLPDVWNSWQQLTTECPKHPDELQVGDVKELANEFNVLVTTDLSTENIIEIVKVLDGVQGIYFSLRRGLKKGMHISTVEDVIRVIEKLKEA